MPSIDALVAERLDISEERARTLLRTMVKELRDQAQEEGVRLPELGTFREEHGTLRFSPSPSLRRLVNRQYEGLQTEELSSAAGYDQEEDESTPTLLDQPDEHSRSASSSAPEPSPDEGRDYPVVGEEREEVRDDESTGGPEPIHEGPESIHDMDEPERRSSPSAESEAEPSSPPSSEAEPEEEPEPAESSGFRPPDSFQLVAGALLLALLIGVGWFVLDQTNVLRSGPSPDAGQTAAREPPPPQSAAPESTAPDTATESSASSSDQLPDRYPGVDPSETADRGSRSTAQIDPAAGGWTIVVASTTDRSSASPLLARYKNRFADTALPIDIVVGTVDDEVRYRVAFGQYDSRGDVRRALKKYESMLPAGAWPLHLDQ